MKNYWIAFLIIVIACLALVYLGFRFDKLESEIIRSTLFISDTLDAMYFD